MAIEISTAGIKLKYAPETTAGTRPTTGYTEIPGVKSIPEIGNDVNTLETTPLSATEYKTYILGLKDPGGTIAITANDYDGFRTAWAGLNTAYETAKTGNKEVYFEVAIPGHDSYYFTGIPAELGFGGAEVDSVLEITANIAPTGNFIWATAST